ncbi:MAG TPA: peptide chain release factor N(5)-glutamine methyltransferase [Thermoanaerobaculia bacterium]
MPVRVRDLLEAAAFQARFVGSDATAWDARILLAHAMGRSGPLALDPVSEISDPCRQRFERLWGQRLAGNPVQHLTGEWDFYGRPFFVDERALVPRPETEGVVAAALLEAPGATCILDCGTGGGIIAVTCALERPTARVTALDISLPALALARRNAQRHGVLPRLSLLASDWLSALRDVRFDLVVANPPYLAADEEKNLSPTVRDHDPRLALYSGADGLSAVRTLLDILPPYLDPGAPFVFEIGFGQAASVERELASRTSWRLLRIEPDLSEIPRAVVLRRA